MPHHEYYIEYEDNSGFEKLARWAGVMDNIKANVPAQPTKGRDTMDRKQQIALGAQGFCLTDE